MTTWSPNLSAVFTEFRPPPLLHQAGGVKPNRVSKDHRLHSDMDTSDALDPDVKLHLGSAALVGELKELIPRFLFRLVPAKSDGTASTVVRRVVKNSKTDHLIKLVP